MPIYEFQCRECGRIFERSMPIKDYHEPPCPICERKTEQIFSNGNGGFSFERMITKGKDTGIYFLDYGPGATYDVTYPAKRERLKRDGRWKDWF